MCKLDLFQLQWNIPLYILHWSITGLYLLFLWALLLLWRSQLITVQGVYSGLSSSNLLVQPDLALWNVIAVPSPCCNPWHHSVLWETYPPVCWWTSPALWRQKIPLVPFVMSGKILKKISFGTDQWRTSGTTLFKWCSSLFIITIYTSLTAFEWKY